MEIHRCGDRLLRLNTSSLMSLLTPSISSAWRPTCRSRHTRASLKHFGRLNRRLFAIAACNRAEAATASKPEPEAESEPERPEDPLAGIFPDKPQGSSFRNLGRSTSSAKDARSEINARLDSLCPPRRDRATRPSSTSTYGSSSGVSELLAKSKFSERGGIRQGDIASAMDLPPQTSRTSPLQEMAERGLDDSNVTARRSKRTLRSRPSVGRTVEVEPKYGSDLGGAIRKLNILVARNRVRRDLNRQKFHERPGLRRKRLKSERWRVYFKAGFQATVKRVRMMKRQGW